MVIGQSGAGKTVALRRLIDGRRELTPHNIATGPTMPFVSITARSPCTLKQLAIELLRALGYPRLSRRSGSRAWTARVRPADPIRVWA
ncbi:ATP-binding protein [Microvirga sp. M2]|uniref:ATP-binding protein n=1 Tax=Microvirga sp. M2 TaxID=3073270 RepID=UPI0039C04588